MCSDHLVIPQMNRTVFPTECNANLLAGRPPVQWLGDS